MTQKTYKLVTAIVGGLNTIAVGCVTYFVNDATTAAAINASIVIACTAALEICSNFVKE